ncbi:MAG: MFS transporter, partial [Chloroflexi bacterium]|nr:MFS transporter [Chloroflexota bacterium]
MLKAGPLRAFNSKQFRLLWVSSLLSIVSFFMVLVSRGWIVLELTDSPFMVTAVSAVPMLPILIASPVGGIAADRISRRLILVVGDAVSCLSLLILGALIVADAIEVWHIFALSFLHGLAFATMMPARMAMVPDVLEASDMASGVAIFSAVFSAGMFVGPAPAGLLIEYLGVGQTFIIAAAMLVPAVAILFVVNIPRL